MNSLPVYVDTIILVEILNPMLMYLLLATAKIMIKIWHWDSVQANKYHVIYKSWPILKTLQELMRLKIVVPKR